jgi:cupin 2 domain-containing protein
MTVHGRLLDGDAAPATGERTEPLIEGRGFRVEQILSGRLAASQEYEQEQDEWVVLLAGSAVLEVDGVEHELGPGEWWFLPGGTGHRLVRTEPGTSWLAVRSTR